MRIANAKRNARSEHIRQKSYNKYIRKGIRLGFFNAHEDRGMYSFGWNNHKRYDDWCWNKRSEAIKNKPPTLKEMRGSIVKVAIKHQAWINWFNKVKRLSPSNWIIDYVNKAGLFDIDKFTIRNLPKLYRGRLFDWYREMFIGKSLDFALVLMAVMKEDIAAKKLDKELRRNGYQTANNSARQLRALGFVA